MITNITVTYPPRYTPFKRKDENQRHVYGDRYIPEIVSDVTYVALNLLKVAQIARYLEEHPEASAKHAIELQDIKISDVVQVTKKKRNYYVPNAIITEEDI